MDFRKNQVDLAIRRLDFAVPETWNVRTLFPEKVGPVMRPELVPEFEHGDYLALGSKTRPDAWAQWLKTHPSARRPTEIRYYDNHALIVEAASAGLGVALSPLVLAIDDVERGSLAAPAGFDADRLEETPLRSDRRAHRNQPGRALCLHAGVGGLLCHHRGAW